MNEVKAGAEVVVIGSGAAGLTAAEQFDKAMFKGATIYDRRYLVVDSVVGAAMALVRFGTGNINAPPPEDIPAPAPLPEGMEGMPTPTGPMGDPFVSEIFAISQGKIVEIQAFWIPPKEQLPTPFLGRRW